MGGTSQGIRTASLLEPEKADLGGKSLLLSLDSDILQKNQLFYPMKKHPFAMIFIGLLLLSSCGSSEPEKTEVDTPTDQMDEAKEEALPPPSTIEFMAAFDEAMHEHRVILEGYLQLPGTMYTSGEKGSLDFTRRPFQRYGDDINVSIRMGDCANCMAKVADKYSRDDLKVNTDDGQVVGPNQRVRVTGKLRVHASSVSKSGVSVSLDPEKIERAEEQDLDYAGMGAVKVTTENLFDTTLTETFAVATGKLEIPYLVFMNDDVSLNLKVGKEHISASFLFGDGPNLIAEIPEQYTKKDFKIKDHNGKLIRLDKPVTLYGTRTAPKADYAGILYVERVEQ